MPGSQLNVHLYRDSFKTPWGFRLQGGKDLNQALTVQRVFSNSPAEGELQRGDVILAIGGTATIDLKHKEAQDAIKNSGGQIFLVVSRPAPGNVHVSPISPPIVTQRPRAPSLQDRSPQRPQNFHNTNPSQNHHYYNTNSSPNYNNMNHPRQHNVPIHVHIEPSRPTTQKSYYVHTPSPKIQQQHPGFSPNHNPYATMPRKQRGYSQPPFQSPTASYAPPPPWATQQTAPKKVSKLSRLGGGGGIYGTSFQGSTLSRYASQPNVAQYHVRRPEPDRDEVDAPDLFQERRPTGPPPKVCSLARIGGGDINFATGVHGQSQTLPRRNIPRRLSQPPSMPSRSSYGSPQQPFGSDYGRPGTTPAQRYEPATRNAAMLNRVQSSLDNITLSPRTPEPAYGGPFYQPPPQQQPAQFYTPTSLLLEQQKMEEERQRQQQQQQQRPQQPQYQPQHQHQPQHHAPQLTHQQQQLQDGADEGEEEPIVPVWERRRQFQDKPQKAAVRSPRGHQAPKVQRPAPGQNSYTDLGTSYSPQTNTSSVMWQPSPKPKPVAAPVPAKPQVIHFSSAPAGPAPGSIQSPVKSAPPPWKRTQDSDDETDGTPAWRNTLRSTGVKPWDVDLNYQQEQHQQEAHRGGSPQPQPQKQQGQGLPGGRDWSQSQVLQFIQMDGNKKPKGKAGPVTAPKPHPALRQYDQQPQQHQQQPRQQQPQKKHHQPPPQHHHDDMGISDF